MKKTFLVLSLVSLAVVSFSCEEKPKKEKDMDTETTTEITEKKEEAKEIKISLEPKSESTAEGTVTFTQENGKVTFMAELTGLEPGTHAIHIHEKADCSSADGKSAGGHWNPTKQKHGRWGDPKGYHKGDIGNFEVGNDGKGTITLTTTTDIWCIDCEDTTKNVVGKGIIVHAGADDYVSQPSGDAGGRVSCGGIIE